MSDDELTDRFLNACEDAKRALERRTKKSYTGLGEALRRDGDHPLVKPYIAELKAYVELRNAIAHGDRRDGKPIATPRADAVERMEALALRIENPPKVSQFMVKALRTVREETTLREASLIIVQESLSQLPVVNESGRVEWLLTTNALARWLGAMYKEDGFLVEEGGTVAEVRAYAEQQDRAETTSPNTLARKACNRLSASDAPAALLVTTNGKESGQLQGILTRFDVPRVLAALSS
ncbi:CBS domain-containing protein [Serinibacter salmoneus]|nr:CBS domain-containing protein [Serinibacter salmoneus]